MPLDMLLRWFRRRAIRSSPFPVTWEGLLRRDFPRWNHLEESERARMRDEIRYFIAERYWEGCAGIEVTDRMKVLIAAQACMLLLHRPRERFANVSSILIYPNGYFASNGPTPLFGAPRVIGGQAMPVLGQAHERGPVILSWRHAEDGARDEDGQNLVYHEFAHKLDMMNGVVDGTPPLDSAIQARDWRQTMSSEFDDLRQTTRLGIPSVLRPYALTNPAEFFAVATEVYFERPDDLRDERPELFRVLDGYYRPTVPSR